MNNIQVSIIVPIYNAGKYIEDCANSILTQTFSNLELILVDDGSKDNSLELCQRIAEKDSRVKVLHKENGGTSSAKNYGIKNAIGDYIAFCDADDTLDNEYIENLYKGVAIYNADACVGNVAFTRTCDSKVVSQRTVEMYEGIFSLKEFMEYYPKYMPNAVIGAPWNKLYRRSIIIENELVFNTKIKNNEDTHFNFEFLAKCENIYVSKAPYYNYMDRVEVVSASKGYIPNIFEIYTLTYKKAVDFLNEIDLYDEYISFQNTYYIDLVIGAINGIVNGKNKFSKKEKIEQIKKICANESVCSAVGTVKHSSVKKQLAVNLIQMKQARFLYYMFSLNK